MKNRSKGQRLGIFALTSMEISRTVSFAVLSIMLLAPFVARAQSLASVSGFVTDPTGAVVPSAKVTITDIARGVPVTTTTNQDGVFLVKNLIPSTYKITAEASGFQTYVLNSFPLTATQEAVLNVTLQVGTSSQAIEVSGQVQLVEPSNATLGGLVSSKAIADLPLVNRNVLTLMAVQPGVTPTTPNNYQSNFFTSAIRYSFNGGLESTSDFQLDGISILNQSDIPGIMGLTMLPSIDSVDEMRVQTSSYSASYGRSGGGIATMVTKSGTNMFHGTAYEFLRNNAFNANGFFSNRSGAKIAPLHINQFGGSLGGPVIKNKTFFFGLFEKNINNSGGFSLFSVPTALQRAGDFSQTYNANGSLKTIYNPFTTPANPDASGAYQRQGFAGNRIPISLLDPTGMKAAAYWPAANLPGTPIPGTSNFVAQNNLGLTASSANPVTEISTKVDHNFSERQRAFIRYSYLYNVAGSPNYFNNLADEGYGPMTVHAHNAAIGYTHTFGASTVLDLRAGANRFSAIRPSNGLGFSQTSLGLPSSLDTYLQQGNVKEFPGIAVQGYSTLGNNNGPYYESHELDFIFTGTLSKVIGKHTLTVGAEQRDYTLNFFQTNPLLMNFGTDMTQGPNARTVSNAGDGVASMLLGTGVGTGSSGGAGYYARTANGNHYLAQFVQDDFKLARNFTINIGFRLEEETGTTERYNRMAAINPAVLNPISNMVANPFTGQTPWNLYGGYIFAGNGTGTLGRSAIRNIEWKPNPRLGIAYSINDKTVIRAAYGIFFGVPYAGATREFTSGAFSTSTPWIASVDGIHPTNLVSNMFPSAYIYPPGTSQGLLSAIGQNLSSAYPPDTKTLYSQQWNFSIQRSITADSVMQIAYVGNKGTHLNWYNGGGSVSMNQLVPQYSSLGNTLLNLVPNPFYGVITSGGPLAQPTVQYGQLIRPFPAWQTVASDGIAIGNSEYNALQTSFTKRFASGLNMIAGYTWSKLMSDISDGVWSSAGSIRSYYCVRCEHSPSSYDTPHRFTLSATGELPFGKGKRFGSNWNGFVNAILGGWQANGILTLNSGHPLVFTTAANNSYTFGGGQHPNAVGNPVLSSGQSIYQWFNTAAFAQPSNFTSGNLSRTYTGVRMDWTRNLDASLFKSFRITERFNLQFRAETFNLTNTPVFNGPGTTLNGTNFGVVTSQSNSPRNLQLGLKLLF